jgi:hypothetical protein
VPADASSEGRASAISSSSRRTACIGSPLYQRQNVRIQERFSCGLLYHHPPSTDVTLARYNGSDHEHEKPLESSEPSPLACHMHWASERYMTLGRKAEHYADTTDRYTALDGALRTLARTARSRACAKRAALVNHPALKGEACKSLVDQTEKGASQHQSTLHTGQQGRR